MSDQNSDIWQLLSPLRPITGIVHAYFKKKTECLWIAIDFLHILYVHSFNANLLVKILFHTSKDAKYNVI